MCSPWQLFAGLRTRQASYMAHWDVNKETALIRRFSAVRN